MIDIYAASVIAFFVALGIAIWRDRKNIEFKYVLLIRRSKRGKKFIEKVAKSYRKFWKIFATMGVLICFYMMFTGFSSMVLTLQLMIKKIITIPAAHFLLPILTPQPVTGPAYIGIPFWFWIIVVAVVMFPHELSHGIIMRTEKIRIKSVGLLLLLIFPGAFVDPDEKEFKKSKLISKLRVVSAGSLANFVVSFLLLVITQFFVWSLFVEPGILITDVNSTSPAGAIGLEGGMVLQEINDKKMDINYFSFYTVYGGLLFYGANATIEDVKAVSTGLLIRSELRRYNPGESITLQADGRSYELTLGQNPTNSSLPYIGISTTLSTKADATAFTILFPLLTLCILLSYGIGLFNILPIYPLDGGLIVQSLAERIMPKYSQKIVMGMTSITLILMALSFIGPLLIV